MRGSILGLQGDYKGERREGGVRTDGHESLGVDIDTDGALVSIQSSVNAYRLD